MYFVPKGNRFIIDIRATSHWHLLISCLFLATLTVFWFNIIYKNLNTYINIYEQDIKTLSRKRRSLSNINADCERLESNIVRLTEEFYSALHTSKVIELNDLLANLLKSIDKYELKLISLKYEKTKILKHHNNIDFNIEFNGNYSSVINFFHSIFGMSGLINCQNFTLKNLGAGVINCIAKVNFLILDKTMIDSEQNQNNSEQINENNSSLNQSGRQPTILLEEKSQLKKQRSLAKNNVHNGLPFFERDPFLFVAPVNFTCSALGSISVNSSTDTTKYFALISINNKLFRVFVGDLVEGHKITKISQDGVIIKNSSGIEKQIYKQRALQLKIS